MATAKTTHDVVFTDREASPNEVGLMLARDSGGRRMYRRIAAKQVPDVPLRQGAPSFTDFNPEHELVWQMTNWDQGFGRYRSQEGDARYGVSDGLDLRFSNRINLAPKLNQLDFIVRNGKFSGGFTSGLADGWAASSGITPTQETTTVKVGGAAQKIVPTTSITSAHINLLWFEFDNPVVWHVATTALRVGFSWYPTGTNAASFVPFIQDDNGTTNGSAGTADQWNSAVLTKNIQAGSNLVRIGIKIVYGDVGTGDTCILDDVFVNEGNNAADYLSTGMVEFEGNLYMSVGRLVVKLDDSTGVWKCVRGDTVPITALDSYGGNLYAARGTSNSYIYSSNGTSWTHSTLTDPADKAEYFTVVRNTLWKARTANLLNSSTNPVNGGSWSANFTVGDTDRDITQIYGLRDLIFVGREDGLWGYKRESEAWDGGTDRFIDLFPDFRWQPSANNFKTGRAWQGALWLTTGRNGLMAYDINSLQTRTPALQGPDFKDFGGQIRGIGGDTDWLFAAEVNPGATISNILAARYAFYPGEGLQFRWHTMVSTRLGSLDFASVDGNYYYVTGHFTNTNYSETEVLTYRWNLPSKHANYAFESSPTFQTIGQGKSISGQGRPYVVTAWYDGDFAALQKEMLKLVITSQDLSSGARQIDVEYQTDDEDDDDAWNTFATFNTSPSQTKYAKAAITTQSNRVFRRMRFRFNFYTNSESNNLTMFSFALFSTLLIPQRDVFQMTCLLEDNQTTLSGIDTEVASTKLANLKTLRDAAGFTGFDDIDGTSHDVRFKFEEEYLVLEPGPGGSPRPQRVLRIEARALETSASS